MVPPAFIIPPRPPGEGRGKGNNLGCALTGGPGSLTVTPCSGAPLRERLSFFKTPEWISPPGCLPRTDRQVAEQRNGYLSPGMSLIMADYILHSMGVKVGLLHHAMQTNLV